MQLSRAKEQFNKMHHNLGSSPLILWFVGGLILLLWLCGTVTQVQTSEYLAQGNSQQIAGVAWSVLEQPWLLLMGQVPMGLATSYMYGWIVEAITLVYAVAIAAAYFGLASVNRVLAKIFIVAGLLLLALNSIADFNGAASNNGLVRFLVALALGIIVTCGLPVGLALVEKGFSEYGE